MPDSTSPDAPRVAIITGAASGIGYAIATALQRAGHCVVIADRNASAAQAVAAELEGLAVTVDLAQSDACRDLVAQTVAHYGRVDIQINNAGFQHIAPIEEFPEEVWNTM